MALLASMFLPIRMATRPRLDFIAIVAGAFHRLRNFGGIVGPDDNLRILRKSEIVQFVPRLIQVTLREVVTL